jgi:hypothetical protein
MEEAIERKRTAIAGVTGCMGSMASGAGAFRATPIKVTAVLRKISNGDTFP